MEPVPPSGCFMDNFAELNDALATITGDMPDTTLGRLRIDCGNMKSCGKHQDNAKLRLCSGCQGAIRYCSTECQREDWPIHKSECKERQKAHKKLNAAGIFFKPSPELLSKGQQRKIDGIVEKNVKEWMEQGASSSAP